MVGAAFGLELDERQGAGNGLVHPPMIAARGAAPCACAATALRSAAAEGE
jgi:hypothetical protein